MLVTNSKNLFNKIEDLMQYDKRKKYKVAYNYGLSDIQAALGISQLNKLPFFIKRRKQIAKKYNKAFKELPITLPPNSKDSFPYRYILKFKDKKSRDALENYLKKQNIGVDKPVFKPLHQYLNLNPKDFPNTEKVHKTTLSIPIYPALTDKEVDYIIKPIRDFFKKSPRNIP